MKYTCEGRRVFAAAVREKLTAKIEYLKEKGAKLGGTDPVSKKLEEKLTALDKMKRIHDENYIGRGGCGHDLTEQIDAIPDDGEDYEYECPKCGNKGSVMKMPEDKVAEG